MSSAERIKELLRYEPESGKLYWRESRGRVSKGAEAGCVKRHGPRHYLHLKIDGRDCYAHRLAWLLMTGEWPQADVDHIDGNGLNNQWSNLRDVSRQVNLRNQRIRSDNTSGVLGVTWSEKLQKWRAEISVDGKPVHLGVFRRIECAISARKAAERDYGFHQNHGKIRELEQQLAELKEAS